MKIKLMWKINAKIVSDFYDGYVDWDEEFYNCPKCGEPIYNEDWSPAALKKCICPICGFGFVEDEEKEE